jgi:hypothetical protein
MYHIYIWIKHNNDLGHVEEHPINTLIINLLISVISILIVIGTISGIQYLWKLY